jgi:hypothetical protein
MMARLFFLDGESFLAFAKVTIEFGRLGPYRHMAFTLNPTKNDCRSGLRDGRGAGSCF